MPASLSTADVRLVREIITELSEIKEPDRVLSCVTRGAAHLCQTRLAAITMLSESRDQLRLVDVVGTGGLIVEEVLPVAQSLNGMVITSGRSFRSADVWRDSRPIVRTIALRNTIRGVLIVPLATPSELLGTLAVARRRSWHFSARDQGVLEDFAHIASMAIENTRLREQLHEARFASQDARLGANPIPFTARNGTPRGERGPRGKAADPYRLTTREHDIVALLMADRTCQEVASALGLSRHTVRHYLERLKLRFGQTTLHGLVSLLGHVVSRQGVEIRPGHLPPG